MNSRGEEQHSADKKGKRSILEVNEELPTSILRVSGSHPPRPPIRSFPKGPAGAANTLPVVIDSFGAINILRPTDKFGAVQEWDNNQSSSFGSTFSRSRFENPLSSLTTYTCILDERTNDYDHNGSGFEGPPIKRVCDSSRYDAKERRAGEKHVHFQYAEPTFTEGTVSHVVGGDGLSPSTGLRDVFDTRTMPTPSVPHFNSNFDETRLQSAGLSSSSHNPPRPQHFRSPQRAQSLDLNEFPKPSIGEDSRISAYSSGSDRENLSNYKFGSIGRQAYLRQRMEERQRMQDATPEFIGLPQIHGAERCRHVVSPEDLIWLNIRNYCGMVLDRETGAVLGTAVLFIPTDSKNWKSAWVTSVNTVEGRWEVDIRDGKGEIQVAKLMLTSTAFGLAFFSVRTWQKTFALAFLSMVTGPHNLPHRASVDAERGDHVYVFGYEEPWALEIGKVADVRVRPGRVKDAGNMEIVEIDFTNGRLGGSITTPVGFSGGLVTRADGLWVGVVTGHVVAEHTSQIDFCSAYNVYSFLEEL